MTGVDSSPEVENDSATGRRASLESVEQNLLFRDHSLTRQALGRSVWQWTRIGVCGRWVVNSHPKSGTHLIRNIMLHMNADAVNQEILFYNKYAEVKRADDRIYITHFARPALVKTDNKLDSFRLVLLLRHPGAIALALARAFYDVNTTRADHVYLRERAKFAEIVDKVVCGYACEGLEFGPLEKSLAEMALDWLPAALFTLKFEEMLDALGAADTRLLGYFGPLLEAMFEAVPADAAARIRAAAKPEISATYSRTQTSDFDRYQPEDVFSMVSRPAATRLQAIAAALGY